MADARDRLPREVAKPWGREIIWAETDRYAGKIIEIEAGRRLSLQYHDVKDEWIRVLSGRLVLALENDAGDLLEVTLGPGEGAHVPPRRRHRFTAVERTELIEVSSPELADVIRLADDFGREGTSAP